jgi:hypothetical protein
MEPAWDQARFRRCPILLTSKIIHKKLTNLDTDGFNLGQKGASLASSALRRPRRRSRRRTRRNPFQRRRLHLRPARRRGFKCLVKGLASETVSIVDSRQTGIYSMVTIAHQIKSSSARDNGQERRGPNASARTHSPNPQRTRLLNQHCVRRSSA